MALSLSKGGNLSLAKVAAGLTNLHVGLGWEARSTDGSDFDLDAAAFALQPSGKVRSNDDFAYYGQMEILSGAVRLSGDNRTGAGEGDDESILVNLGAIPAAIEQIAVCVTIHEGDARRQNFGMVRKAYVRLVDAAADRELARYDLSEDASLESAMIFAELYRHNGDWKFRAVGQGFVGGLGPLARSFGVDIS